MSRRNDLEPTRRGRSITVLAGGTAVFAVAALALTFEGDSRRDYQGVCVDEVSHTRAEDARCDSHAGGYHQVYFPAARGIPGSATSTSSTPAPPTRCPPGTPRG